jgi:hypothetical protein
MDQPLGNSPQFNTQLHEGSHSIRWAMSDSDAVEIPFDIGDTISLKTPVVRGSLFGFIGVLNKTEMAYQAINFSGGITKIAEGHSQQLPDSGKLLLQNAQTVALKMRYGAYPLGDFQADPAGPQLIYIRLGMLPRNVGNGKSKPKVETPESVQTSEPASAEPPEEDLVRRAAEKRKEDYLRKLRGESSKTGKQ